MARTMTQEEMDKLLPHPTHSTPQGRQESVQKAFRSGRATEASSEPQQAVQEAARARPGRAPAPDGICLSDRPQMPQGWMNSNEGLRWMENRAEAFTMMTYRGMMFASTKKEKDGKAKAP